MGGRGLCLVLISTPACFLSGALWAGPAKRGPADFLIRSGMLDARR